MEENQTYIQRTSGLKLKEKFGYALGDVASLMVFALVTSFLQRFYTDVLKINLWWVLILFIATRLWDAINDPIWGRIIDTRKVGREGRYRPWLVRLAIPTALSATLMFIKIPGLNATQYFIYACVTYILFEMLYTGINIPYGSLASVITTDEKERASLSVFRSVGSVLGNFPALILMAVVPITAENSTKLAVGVGLTALLSVFVYYACYKLTKERVPSQPTTSRTKGEVKKIIVNLLKSRPFISLCVAAMLLLATQMFVQSYYLYLFNYYFHAQWLNTINQVATYLPVALLMFFMGKVNKTVGKKEICALGMLFASLPTCAVFHSNEQSYCFSCAKFLSGIGNTFFFLQVWALLTDAIDYTEVRTAQRDDATSYSFFTFTRKLGQSIAAVLSLLALISFGYQEWVNDPSAITTAALSQMYNLAVLIPAVMYLIMAVILWFWYPLDKKSLAQLQIQKEENLKQLFDKQG